MKLKINKACDLSSISVLPPPQSRRSNAIASSGGGHETSMFGTKNQASQLRSQQSQQSFSQGMSQLSQNSFDEILTNDQRFGSQGDNSTRRTSCLAPVAYNREETQMQLSRSSNNHLRRWSSVPAQDHKCQVSEELEHRIGLIETSLNRFGMLLDSVQGDVMQVNKAIKEVSLETEGIRKKLAGQDNSLQLMLKGEEDIKASLDGSVKCIPEQLRKDLHQYRLQEAVSILLSLPDHIEAQLLKIRSETCGYITKELEAILSSIKLLNHKSISPTPPLQRRSYLCESQKVQLPVMKNPFRSQYSSARRTPTPKVKIEDQGFINPKKSSLTKKQHRIKNKEDEVTIFEQDKEWGVLVESDEDIDDGFSCLLEKKETGMFYKNLGMGVDSLDDVKGETERILRKARRRKRKHGNPIILI